MSTVSVESARSLTSGDGCRLNGSATPLGNAFRVSRVDRSRHSDKLTGEVGESPPVVGDWPAAASRPGSAELEPSLAANADAAMETSAVNGVTGELAADRTDALGAGAAASSELDGTSFDTKASMVGLPMLSSVLEREYVPVPGSKSAVPLKSPEVSTFPE